MRELVTSIYARTRPVGGAAGRACLPPRRSSRSCTCPPHEQERRTRQEDSQNQIRMPRQIPKPMGRKHHRLAPPQLPQPLKQIMLRRRIETRARLVE